MNYTVLAGYSPIKEFYAPNYGEQQLNANHADLKRTLLWKPNVPIDKTSRTVTVSFRLVIEGMAEDGRLLHFSKLLQ